QPCRSPRRRLELPNPKPAHEPGVAEEARVTSRLESAPWRVAGAAERKSVSLVSAGEHPVRDPGIEEQRWLGPEIWRLQRSQFPNGGRSASPRPTLRSETEPCHRAPAHLCEAARRLNLLYGSR